MQNALTSYVPPAVGESRRNQFTTSERTNTVAASHPITVVFVSGCQRDEFTLRNHLRGSAWSIIPAHDVPSALALVLALPDAVVICSDNLRDGTWHDVFDHVKSLSSPPAFILATAANDSSIWAEAVNVGAYDVVARPFELEEILHVVKTAHLCPRRFAYTTAEGT